MDKFQVYLTKQHNKQRKAFQKIRNKMGSEDGSNLLKELENSKSKIKNSSSSILSFELDTTKKSHNNSI